jgi:Tfp pilus assembly protein PilF
VLKVAPYILVPAWMIILEFRSTGMSRRAHNIVISACIVLLLLITGEAWRVKRIENLRSSAFERLRRGETVAALKEYRQLVRLSPRDEVGYMGKAAAHAILGDVESAIGDFERSIRLAPENVNARLNYGHFLFKRGKIDESARVLEEARVLSPHNSTVLYHLARIRLQQERADESIQLLTRARELQPGDSGVLKLLKKITTQ